MSPWIHNESHWLPVVDQNSQCTSHCLLALIVLEPAAFQALVTDLISGQTSTALQDRLHKAFVALMTGVAQDVSPANRKVFHSRFEAFVHDVHGFVSFK